MTDEIHRRLELIEKKNDDFVATVNQCAQSMQQCASDIKLIQRDVAHKNTLAKKSLEGIQNLVETQNIILFGNPRQDSKDRGLIGDVEQLKSTDARKKKYYWILIPAFITVLLSSFWNSIVGKESHEKSEPTKTTVQKTGPGPRELHGNHRSRRRD